MRQTLYLQSLLPFAVGGSEGPPRQDDDSLTSVTQNLFPGGDTDLFGLMDNQVIAITKSLPGSTYGTPISTSYSGRKLLLFWQMLTGYTDD